MSGREHSTARAGTRPVRGVSARAAGLLVGLASVALAGAAFAQTGPTTSTAASASVAASPAVDATGGARLIPPNIEGPALRAPNGGYCYVGPHPVDTRMVGGGPWDATTGRHYRPYPPLDARLFALRDGCYYFIGDPRDFGFAGQTYAYYGAHPIRDIYGGGWCFMMGPHTHLWPPWSPSFTVVGSWYYWHGPFDPYFWTYWPYYSFYYRTYYPGYYGGGRFYRHGGGRVAPPIRSVPPNAWRAGAVRGAPIYRHMTPTQALRAPGAARVYPGQGIRPVLPVYRPGYVRPAYVRPAYVRPGYVAPPHPAAPAQQRPGGSGIHRR